jgi:hypothetical protein
MFKPRGISIDRARAHVALLDLLLALPDLDVDTARRAQWLRHRLCELLPELGQPFDFIEARIAAACPAEGLRRAASRAA